MLIHCSPYQPMLALKTGMCLGKRIDFFQSNGLSLQRTAYLPNQPTDAMHFHEHTHISLVMSGGNLERRKTLQLERVPGCVTFYHSGEAHQTIQKKFPAQHINLELTNSLLNQYHLPEQQLSLGIQTNPDCALILLKLYKESLMEDCFSAPSVQMLLHCLTPHATTTSLTPLWVSIIYELLQDRWNESITLQEMAIAANVHPVTVSKYFPRYFRCTLGEYMRKLRATKAFQLMKTSALSLTEIAYHCGFADQSHMTRTFQQLTGFAPKRLQQL